MSSSYTLIRKITFYAVFLAISTLLGYVESLIPLPFLPPGVHLGLANACFLFLLLLRFRFYEVFLVDIGRVLLVALLRGSFMSMGFAMSAGGAVLSFAAMTLSTYLLRRWLTPFGHSLLGSTFHGVGQIAAGAIYLWNLGIFYYLPILLILNAVSSLLVGGLVTLLEANTYLRDFIDRFNERQQCSDTPNEDLKTEDPFGPGFLNVVEKDESVSKKEDSREA